MICPLLALECYSVTVRENLTVWTWEKNCFKTVVRYTWCNFADSHLNNQVQQAFFVASCFQFKAEAWMLSPNWTECLSGWTHGNLLSPKQTASPKVSRHTFLPLKSSLWRAVAFTVSPLKKQVSALSDTRNSLSCMSESAQTWLASQLTAKADAKV